MTERSQKEPRPLDKAELWLCCKDSIHENQCEMHCRQLLGCKTSVKGPVQRAQQAGFSPGQLPGPVSTPARNWGGLLEKLVFPGCY